MNTASAMLLRPKHQRSSPANYCRKSMSANPFPSGSDAFAAGPVRKSCRTLRLRKHGTRRVHPAEHYG